jgi:Domain of unknown function (DUF4340)
VSPRITAALAVALALVVGYILLVDRPQAQRAEEGKRLIQVAPKDVTRIVLVNAKGTVDLARRDATHWDVTNPIHMPAASFAVSNLLDTVTGAVPQQSLGVPSDPKEYGLDKPSAQITLTTSKGQTVILQIGKASPVGATSYARVQPGGGLYQVDNSTKESLAKSVNDLRQKTVADFANADVQKVKIVSPAGTIAVARVASDRWRIEGPHAWPADDIRVTDLFFPLTTSEAKAFHDGVTDLAPYDLTRPPVAVDLTLRDRPEPVRVLLAQRGKVTYATVVGTQTVLELDASVQGKLTVEPLSLVSKRILPYNPQNLTAFIWRRAGHTFELRRQGPGFTGEGLAESDISNMFSIVNLLDADQVELLAAPPPGAPAFEIQTDGAADAKFSVQLYRDPKGGWTATDTALALRYHLSGNAFDSLPAKIKTFLGLSQPAAQPQPAPQPGKPAPPARPPAKPTPPAPTPPKK